MNRLQRVPRFAVALAGLAAMAGGPGLAVTGGPGSTGDRVTAAAATWPSVGCRVSVPSPGPRVAVCDHTRSTTTTCSLIPLPYAPAAYLRRLPMSHGQRWVALDCPGRYPFGGVALIPDATAPRSDQPT